jgi:membrane protease YdiL (CAAX protease family)
MNSPWASRATLVFLLIAFGVPWTGWTLLNVLHPHHGTLLWWSLFLTGCFCSVAGFVAAYVESGWCGLGMLLQRTLHVRFQITWWLYALFLFALGGIISTAIYGYAHGGIGPLKPLLLFTLFAPSSLFWLVTGPLGEEFGWRGYLLPRLLQRYSPLTSALVLGVIWEVWHFPLYYRTFLHDFHETASFTIGLMGLSLLITVMFIHTGQSLGPVIALHWTANVTMSAVHKMFPGVRPAPPDAQDPYDMVTMAVITLLVVAVSISSLRQPASQPEANAAV